MTDGVMKEAIISDDGVYRYWLERVWDEHGDFLPWVMLNPSVADHTVDDPTIRRVTDYTRRWGYGGFVVVNLFALRATHPRELATHPEPVGSDNDRQIGSAASLATYQKTPIVVAWGANPAIHMRWRHVTSLLHDTGVQMMALATTEHGHPRHPLYLKKELELQPWEKEWK